MRLNSKAVLYLIIGIIAGTIGGMIALSAVEVVEQYQMQNAGCLPGDSRQHYVQEDC